METIRQRKPRPAYALYAAAIGGGSILISLAMMSIAWTAKGKGDLRADLIQLNWLYTKHDAMKEVQAAWQDGPADARAVAKSGNFKIDDLKAKIDAMVVRLNAKHGAEVRLSKSEPDLAAKLIEADPFIRYVCRTSAALAKDEAIREYSETYSRQNVDHGEANKLLYKRFDESIDDAVKYAKGQFVKITKVDPGELR